MVGDRLRRLSSLSKDWKPNCEHDKELKGSSENSSDVEGTALVKPVPDDGIDNDDRAEIDDLKHNMDSCSEFAWVRKVKKPGRFLGIAKGRKFIKEMQGLYFPLSKGLIFSHGLQSRRHISSKRRRLFKWRRLSKRQHSKDQKLTWEDVFEESHYVEGTTLLKPAPSESIVLPKRRRASSSQDSYTSLEDDNESTGISEDSSDAEGTSLPEVQSSTSEDGSDVEDISDVEDSTNVEDSNNVEDSTYVGEVEYSSDGEYSNDGTTLLKLNMEPTSVTSDDGPLVEIFSILVGGGNSSVPLALCGTIVVRDGSGTFYIFSRHPDCPDKLSLSNKLQQSRTSLSLAWPWRCVVEKNFFMHFKLENAHGQKVCRGSLSWCKRLLVSSGPFDTRICAIIPGENGYFAAVHFSVFKNGLKAKVTVECSSGKDGLNYNNDDHISVYGSVVVEYSNYNYPSTYDKEYYRSIIFKRTKENGVKVKNGSKIPLSKSMVSAPSDCEGINVDVDLLVISSGEQCRFGRAFGRIRFKANKNGVCEMRDGDSGKGWRCADCHIKVMVDWVH